MLWGSFGWVHIFSLLVGAGIIIGLYYLLKNKSEKVQLIVLGILSFSGVSAIIFNLVTWGSPLEYLPLHLCSLSAMVLPFAVLLKNKVLSNLLLLWSLGALMALVINTSQADYEIFSFTFAFYFFPHVLEFGIPIMMFKLKLVEKDFRCILSTVAITWVSYTAIHFVNVALNNYFIKNNILDWAGNVVQVNYMFSITPENPVLVVFKNILPYDYWYMLLVIPVVVIYLSAIYCKQIIMWVKEKRDCKTNG